MNADILFDAPWWLPVTILGIGLFVFVHGNSRQERTVLRTGAGIMLLGLIVLLTSYLVQTPRERAVHRTREIVRAVNDKDWAGLRSRLDEKTSLYTILRGPEAIASAAQRVAEGYQLGSVRITGMDVEKTDTVITVTIRCLSDQLGRSAASDWRFQYQNLGQGWILYTIESVGTPGVSDERIRRELLNPSF